MTLSVLLFGCMARVPKADVLYAWSSVQPGNEHTLAQIAEDREVFRATCGECHLPPAARWFDNDEWPRIVERMRTRHHAKFDDAVREHVLRYLATAHDWDAAVRSEKGRAEKRAK